MRTAADAKITTHHFAPSSQRGGKWTRKGTGEGRARDEANGLFFDHHHLPVDRYCLWWPRSVIVIFPMPQSRVDAYRQDRHCSGSLRARISMMHCVCHPSQRKSQGRAVRPTAAEGMQVRPSSSSSRAQCCLGLRSRIMRAREIDVSQMSSHAPFSRRTAESETPSRPPLPRPFFATEEDEEWTILHRRRRICRNSPPPPPPQYHRQHHHQRESAMNDPRRIHRPSAIRSPFPLFFG